MTNSSVVAAGDVATYEQYNNVRRDAINLYAWRGEYHPTLDPYGVMSALPDFSYVAVSPYGGAASDELNNIWGGNDGQVYLIYPAAGKTITLVEGMGGQGQLLLGGRNITLSDQNSVVALAFDYDAQSWRLIGPPGLLLNGGGSVVGNVSIAGALFNSNDFEDTTGSKISFQIDDRASPGSASTLENYGLYVGSCWDTVYAGTSQYAAYLRSAINANTTLTNLRGLYIWTGADSVLASAGTITNLIGNTVNCVAHNATVTTMYDISLAMSTNNGAVTTAGLLYVGAATKGSSGSYTTLYGAYFAEQTAGTTNYTVMIASSSGVASGGLWFSTDTVLYRSAAHTLKTDDMWIGSFSSTAITGTRIQHTSTLTCTPASNTTLDAIALQGECIWNSSKNADSAQGGNFVSHIDVSGGTFTAVRGVRGQAYGNTSITGTLSFLMGMYSVIDAEDLTVAYAAGFWFPGVETKNGVVTGAYGMYLGNGAISGTGSFTYQFGIYIAEQTLGATKYALYLDGTSYGLGSALSFAGQVNLYLGAANSLYLTANVFRITSTVTGDSDIFQVFSGANQVMQIDGRGDLVMMLDKAYGFVCRDRATDAYRRIVITNGTVSSEAM